ncbi:hypothetical protein AAK967_08370 [Atopobiaceae bacterium 24-176]
MDMGKKEAEMKANEADPVIVEDATSVEEETEGACVPLTTDPADKADEGFVGQDQVELEN